MTNRINIAAGVIAALLLTTSCCHAKDITIGFSHIALNNPYYIAMEKAAREGAKAHGITLMIENAGGDVIKQNAQIDAMIEAGVDGLIVNSATEYGLMAVIKKAKERKIPVVAIDRPLYGDYLAYVGIDQWRAGVLQGDYFVKTLLPEGGSIVVLVGTPGEPATIGRGNGMTNIVEHPKFNRKYKILASYRADYNRELGHQKMKEAIAQFAGSIDLVYCLNDAMALGALDALREAGLDKVLVAGIDGQKEAYEEIAKGGQYRSTVINDPAEITHKAIDILATYLRSKIIPETPNVITGTILVTKVNVAKYYNPRSEF